MRTTEDGSVPVLSEQMSVTAPRASRESSLRTMTLRATMAFVPPARVMVRTTCGAEEESANKRGGRREGITYDEGGGDHRKGDRNGVENDLLVAVERVGGEAEKCEDASDSEHCKQGAGQYGPEKGEEVDVRPMASQDRVR